MNTCESCKFWNRDHRSDVRLRIGIEEDDTHGLCMLHSSTEAESLKNMGYDAEYIHSSNLAFTCSVSESVGAEFFTEPNFGCVQHELKDDS